MAGSRLYRLVPPLCLVVGFLLGVIVSHHGVEVGGPYSRRVGRSLLASPDDTCECAASPAGAWKAPASPKGTVFSFRQYMAAVPARYRPAISEWRRTTYLSQVWARRAQKYRQQLEVWDANAEAAAEGKDIEAGPEDNMVWWTNASKQELLRLQREADGKVDQLFPLARSLKDEAEKAAKEGGFPLWVSATSPLPEDRPVWRTYNVSLLLQYFRRPAIIEDYTRRLWECTHGDLGTGALGPGVTSELIVNVDSRGDAKAWDDAMAKYSRGRFVNLVFSNDLHEVHGYNRLAAVARGTVLVLLQDDDLPPDTCSWLKYVLLEFEKRPKLGAVGLRNGIMFHPHTANDDVFRKGHPDEADKSWEVCRETRGIKNSPYRDAELGLPFSFVAVVDMAPLALRREAFLSVGGFDEGFAEPGECGILTDWELSMRLWNDGWQVALVSGAFWFFQQMGVGGTHAHPLTGALCWHKQPRLFGHLEERQRHEVGVRILAAVREANAGLERRLEGSAPMPWDACCVAAPSSEHPGVPECPRFMGNPWPADWPEQKRMFGR